MANNIKPRQRAAKNIFIKEGTAKMALFLKDEDLGKLIRALINYFLSDYTEVEEMPTDVLNIIFQTAKAELDNNEEKYARKVEASQQGGLKTQERRRAAIKTTIPTDTLAPDCTIRNIIKFLVEEGLTEQDATTAANDFFDYNNIFTNIEQTKTGELKLLSDKTGRPLFDWQKAVKGFINSGYDREEWERSHNIDPKTHRPRR